MRSFTCLGLLGLLTCGFGCGSDADAAGRRPRPASEPEPRRYAPGERLAGSTGLTSEPASRARPLIEVEILESEEQDSGVVVIGDHKPVLVSEEPPTPESVVLAVRVRVSNNHPALTIPVSPQRFRLETASGQRLLPRTSGERRGAALGISYLKEGESVNGWLSFRVPEEARGGLVLRTNFGGASLRIPLSASDGRG